MTYLFYLCICLSLIIIQTTILPNFPLFERFYDLLILFTLYLGLFRPFFEGLPVILVLGVVMDSISGGPFGLYITTYFWLFVIMRWLILYLHAGNLLLFSLSNLLLLSLVVFAGVLMGNVVFLMAMKISQPDWSFWVPAKKNILFGQLLWVIITGPFFLVVANSIHQRLEKWIKEMSAERNGLH